MKDICKLLGNRQDQDTVSGGGLLTALVNSGRILVGDDYQCLHPEQFCNLSNGKVKQWWPHAASLYCENPFVSERWALITPEDVLINVIRFKNPFSHQMSTFWNVSGNLADAKVSMWTPEKIIFSTNAFHPSVWKNTYIRLQANQPIFEGKVRGKLSGYLVAPREVIGEIITDYSLDYQICLKPKEERILVIGMALGPDGKHAENRLQKALKRKNHVNSSKIAWNEWFHQQVPDFDCDDKALVRLYYYRWWSLRTKLIPPDHGNIKYGAVREALRGFNSVISGSSYLSLYDLRWLRDGTIAWGCLKTLLVNAHNGMPPHHLGISSVNGISNEQVSNSIYTHDYENALAHSAAMLSRVHPRPKEKATLYSLLKKYFTTFCSTHDPQKTNLFTTWPHSNQTGAEFQAAFAYFYPLSEAIHFHLGRLKKPEEVDDKDLLEAVNDFKKQVPVYSKAALLPKEIALLRSVWRKTQQHRLAAPQINTLAIKNAEGMAELALHLGKTKEENYYRKQAEKIRQEICQKLWSKKEKFFLVTDPYTYEQAPFMHAQGFFPFLAGIQGQPYIQALNHLFNPAKFGTTYPVPTLALDSPGLDYFKCVHHWNYYAWPFTTCRIVDVLCGLALSSYPKFQKKAAKLFQGYIKLHFPYGYQYQPCTPEYVDPNTGRHRNQNLDYAHSYLPDLVIRYLAGVNIQANGSVVINPLSYPLKWLRLTGIPYQKHFLDVEIRKKNKIRETILKIDGKIVAKSADSKPIAVYS